jgi:hypothetical protein
MRRYRKFDSLRKRRRSQSGTTLIETLIAVSILLICATGVLNLAAVALTTTENQGHLSARTTEYCQDKLEQLLALSFSDVNSDTTVVPTASSGGSGLAIGGSSDPASPVAGYLDYLDSSGNLLATTGTTAPSGWFYVRVWAISAGPAGASTSKQITVTTKVAREVGALSVLPKSVVTAIKVNPF